MASIEEIAGDVSRYNDLGKNDGYRSVSAIDAQTYQSAIKQVRDVNWSTQTWVIHPNYLSRDSNVAVDDLLNAGKKLKFTDTSMGGNFYLNPYPQASRWADYNEPRLVTNLESNNFMEVCYDISFGMGRWYSETIDDNASIVHIRPGTVSYQSMFMYMLNSYDPVLDIASREGLFNSIAFRLGQASGFISGMSLAIQGTLFAVKSFNALVMGSSTEYASVKCLSAPVWRRAQVISDELLVSSGWRPDDTIEIERFKANMDNSDKIYKVNEDDLKKYNEMMDDVFLSSNAIDLRASVTRAARIRNIINETGIKSYQASLEGVSEPTGDAYLNAMTAATKAQQDLLKDPNKLKTLESKYKRLTDDVWGEDGDLSKVNYLKTADVGTKGGTTAKTFDELYKNLTTGTSATTKNSSLSNSTANVSDDQILADVTANSQVEATNDFKNALYINASDDPKYTPEIKNSVAKYLSELMDFNKAEINDGSMFFSFAVNNNNTATDSFSNTSKEPIIKSFLGSMGSKFRELNMSTAGGNIIPGMGEVIGAATNFIRGHMDGFGIGGLAGLFSQANPSIPNIPDASSASLQNISFTVEARSISGSPLSVYLSQYRLLAIFLALFTPYSSGNQSYGVPPVVEYYQKGYANSRFAIPSSLTVTRGVGTKGWSKSGRSLGMTFTLELTPLATDVHFPMFSNAMASRGLSAISTYVSKGIYNADNVGKDYIQAVAAEDVQVMVYKLGKIRRNIRSAIMAYKTSYTKAAITQTIGDSIIGDFMKFTQKGDYNRR